MSEINKWTDIPKTGRFLYRLTQLFTKIFPSYALALRWAAEVDRQLCGSSVLVKNVLENGKKPYRQEALVVPESEIYCVNCVYYRYWYDGHGHLCILDRKTEPSPITGKPIVINPGKDCASKNKDACCKDFIQKEPRKWWKLWR